MQAEIEEKKILDQPNGRHYIALRFLSVRVLAGHVVSTQCPIGADHKGRLLHRRRACIIFGRQNNINYVVSSL